MEKNYEKKDIRYFRNNHNYNFFINGIYFIHIQLYST